MFATEDGGATWERRNRLSNAGASHRHDHPAAPRDGEIGHCVHNMMRAPGAEDLLYQQNHHGVWRSADGGRSWDDITEGLPSTFGFPIRVHPRDPDTIWTLPLNGDSAGRFPPDAAAAVWRSRDGGQSWQAMREGLPQSACFFTVLRQAMAGDARDPAGVYFGTNSGSVFASLDEGETWQEIARASADDPRRRSPRPRGRCRAGVTAAHRDRPRRSDPAGDQRARRLTAAGPRDPAPPPDRMRSSYGVRLNCSGEGSGSPNRRWRRIASRRFVGRSARARRPRGAGHHRRLVIRARLPGGRVYRACQGQAGARGFVTGQIREMHAAPVCPKSGREPKGSTRSRISPVRAR